MIKMTLRSPSHERNAENCCLISKHWVLQKNSVLGYFIYSSTEMEERRREFFSHYFPFQKALVSTQLTLAKDVLGWGKEFSPNQKTYGLYPSVSNKTLTHRRAWSNNYSLVGTETLVLIHEKKSFEYLLTRIESRHLKTDSFWIKSDAF